MNPPPIESMGSFQGTLTFIYIVRVSIALWLVSALTGLYSIKQENLLLLL